MLILAAAIFAVPQDPSLAAAIEATRPFEVPGRPCLARPDRWPELSAAERRRQREVRSDSHWLNRFVRRHYADRLAFSGLDASGGRLRHVVWLTGTAPVPPLRLTHRAAAVPVEIRYGAPWTERDVQQRRIAAGPARAQLVPDAQGEGFMQLPGAGWINLDVYSPGGAPRDDVLAHCEALRRAYRLPVLISFTPGRVSLH
jgi:hypothetical protein